MRHDGKLHVMLIGALNGDEPIGTEVLIRLARHLAKGEDHLFLSMMSYFSSILRCVYYRNIDIIRTTHHNTWHRLTAFTNKIILGCITHSPV